MSVLYPVTVLHNVDLRGLRVRIVLTDAGFVASLDDGTPIAICANARAFKEWIHTRGGVLTRDAGS